MANLETLESLKQRLIDTEPSLASEASRIVGSMNTVFGEPKTIALLSELLSDYDKDSAQSIYSLLDSILDREDK